MFCGMVKRPIKRDCLENSCQSETVSLFHLRKRRFYPILLYFNQLTGNLRKCVRSEETCPEGASEAYFRTVEKPLGQRFAGDDVFYQCFSTPRGSGS